METGVIRPAKEAGQWYRTDVNNSSEYTSLIDQGGETFGAVMKVDGIGFSWVVTWTVITTNEGLVLYEREQQDWEDSQIKSPTIYFLHD